MSHGLILIVDSDRDSVSQLVEMLAPVPLTVMVAFDQSNAYESTLQHSFDLFLISHGLSDGNGIKLYDRLQRNSERHASVLLANHIDLHVVYDAMSAGFRHVLPKPLDLHQLRFVLSETFDQLPMDHFSGHSAVLREYSMSVAMPDLEAIASLSTVDICEKLTNAELIRIIRSVDYPFAGKERLEYFDRDTLQRVVCLVRRWSQQRLSTIRSATELKPLKATA